MITGRGEGPVQTAKDPARIVRNARNLAMHWRRRPHDRLMAQADPKHWRRLARGADKIETDARFVRGAWTRGEDDGVRLVGERVCDRDLIVAPHRHVRAQFAQVVDEVEREAVI